MSYPTKFAFFLTLRKLSHIDFSHLRPSKCSLSSTYSQPLQLLSKRYPWMRYEFAEILDALLLQYRLYHSSLRNTVLRKMSWWKTGLKPLNKPITRTYRISFYPRADLIRLQLQLTIAMSRFRIQYHVSLPLFPIFRTGHLQIYNGVMEETVQKLESFISTIRYLLVS